MCHGMSGYRIRHSIPKWDADVADSDLNGCSSGFGRMEAGRLLDGAGDGKKVVGLCGFKQIENAGCYAGCDQPYTLVLAADKVTDDKAESAGIHVGNFGEIEDIDRWRRTGLVAFEDIVQRDGAQGRVHVACGKWTRKSENDRIGSRVLPAFNGEGGA